MAELVMLGTARALPTLSQENTYMALVGQAGFVLIDCGGSPYRRLLTAGLDPCTLRTIVLTHAHPDHIYGLPALLMGLWLAGRREPLDIYSLEQTCILVRTMLEIYHPERWPGMFSVGYHSIPTEMGAFVYGDADFEVAAAPVEHTVPAIGLRIKSRVTGRVLTYSGDTACCQGIRFLARGADVLVHEATGASVGHSSAAEAGAVAEEAGVAELVLVHHDLEETPAELLEAEAHTTYHGQVHAAKDFERLGW